MTNKKYKIFFHIGNELELKTRVTKGFAWLDVLNLYLEGVGGRTIPLSSIASVEEIRLHGLGAVIKINSLEGHLYLSVIRFMIGQFAVINYLETRRLRSKLSEVLRQNNAG